MWRDLYLETGELNMWCQEAWRLLYGRIHGDIEEWDTGSHSRMQPMIKAVRKLKKHEVRILNYFTHRKPTLSLKHSTGD